MLYNTLLFSAACGAVAQVPTHVCAVAFMMNAHRKHNNANVFFITFLSFTIFVFFLSSSEISLVKVLLFIVLSMLRSDSLTSFNEFNFHCQLATAPTTLKNNPCKPATAPNASGSRNISTCTVGIT